MINFNEKEMRFMIGLLSQVNVKLTETENFDTGSSVLKKIMKGIDDLKPKDTEKK